MIEVNYDNRNEANKMLNIAMLYTNDSKYEFLAQCLSQYGLVFYVWPDCP